MPGVLQVYSFDLPPTIVETLCLLYQRSPAARGHEGRVTTLDEDEAFPGKKECTVGEDTTMPHVSGGLVGYHGQIGAPVSRRRSSLDEPWDHHSTPFFRGRCSDARPCCLRGCAFIQEPGTCGVAVAGSLATDLLPSLSGSARGIPLRGGTPRNSPVFPVLLRLRRIRAPLGPGLFN